MRLIKILLILALIFPLVLVVSCKCPAYEGGRLALKEGNFDKAIKDFNMALEENPDNAAIYLDLARAYAGKKEWKDAVENVKKAEEMNPELEDLALVRDELWYIISNDVAIPAFNEGEYEKAVEYFEIATQLKPDSSETWDILGGCYGLLGRHEDAVEALEKAYELAPDDINVINNLSKAYLELGENEKAEQLLEEMARLDPENVDVIYTLGTNAYMQEEYDTAIEKFEKVLEIQPEHLDAMYYLASIMLDAKDNYERAIELFEEYTSLYEDDPVAWAKLARAYGLAGETEKALEATKKAEEIQDRLEEEEEETPPPPPE